MSAGPSLLISRFFARMPLPGDLFFPKGDCVVQPSFRRGGDAKTEPVADVRVFMKFGRDAEPT